jgi:hypothetical protein
MTVAAGSTIGGSIAGYISAEGDVPEVIEHTVTGAAAGLFVGTTVDIFVANGVIARDFKREDQDAPIETDPPTSA